MNIDFNDYLPIGSVVLLKHHKKKMMIIGIAQLKLDEEKFYDYVGVIYPEGYVGPASCFLFNKADIEEIVVEGEKLEESNFYVKTMNTMLKSVEEALNT